jgi:acetyltransferase-like isoleucine patch superfamily enzyme
MVRIIARYTEKIIELLFLGNRVKYLRSRGARIGEGCEILCRSENVGYEPYLVRIDDDVTVTTGVQFITHDGGSRVFRKSIKGGCPYGNRFGTIHIKENSFIGMNAILLPNITIGPNSIVGAGSVVTRDVEPDSVYAGVPARKICSLSDYIKKYKEEMIPLKAKTRKELRVELEKLWGRPRQTADKDDKRPI